MAVEWIKVFSSDGEARARILPDRPQLLILAGKRICLVLHENEFFAVQDTCTHNGESLSKGRVNFLGDIVCPWHGYRFNLQSGRATDSSSPDLTTFPVKVDATGFYIGVAVEKA